MTLFSSYFCKLYVHGVNKFELQNTQIYDRDVLYDSDSLFNSNTLEISKKFRNI